MKLLQYLIVGIFLFSLAMLASCISPSPASGPSNDVVTKIVVATDATAPPFEFLSERTRQLQGFDIDIMNAIAARQNFQVEYVNVLYDPLLSGMAQGMYDAAISSITITKDRQRDMLFSEPYFSNGQVVTVSKDNTTITGKDHLAGNVGALRGTAGATETKKIKTAVLKNYDDIEQAFIDLTSGQINAVVCDYPIALLYIGKNPDKLKLAGEVFTDEVYGIAIAKDKKYLQTKINAGLKAVKDEGLIYQLILKWFR
jgi:polar amino acid transport system substrate-binding protein